MPTCEADLCAAHVAERACRQPNAGTRIGVRRWLIALIKTR